jgi:MoaA/NifB/PqqE/SkfB family radical SAM enzyme
VDTIEFYSNEYLQSVRKSWTRGEFHPDCKNCQQAEEHSGTSRRIGSNQWYADHGRTDLVPELIRLDFWTGDLCNLACAICGPDNSSSWREELKWPKELKQMSVNRSWDTLDLTKLEYVHFNGGEPLLSKQHVEFLRAIPVKSQVQITYNTNGTVRPGPELLELWAEFQLVQLDFSIDDIGARFEYQRYPARWNQVSENLQWFKDNCPGNCMFGINTTVSVLNINNLDQLNAWLKKNFAATNYTDPIEHRQQLAYGILELENAQNRSEGIIKYLDTLDSRRHTSWKMTFPELENYLTKPL